MATPVSGANVWLTLNGQPLIFQDNIENLHTHAIEHKNNMLCALPDAPGPIEIFIDNQILDTAVYGYWYWRPKWHAGLYELRIEAPGFESKITKVRVLPGKLTQKRYERMLIELDELATELLFRLNSPAGEKAFVRQREQESSPLRDYRQIMAIMIHFSEVMEGIRRNPYRTLHEKDESRPFHDVRQFSHEAWPLSGEVFSVPETLSVRSNIAALPIRWQVRQKTLTYDVHENRLLKQFVQRQLISRFTFLKSRAESETKRREQQRIIKLSKGWDDDETAEIEKLGRVITDCERMSRRCIIWSSEPFLASVRSSAASSHATQVLLKNPFYSRFYRLYLQFQQELQMSLNTEQYLTTLALRKMWELYEIWSVFRISMTVIEELMKAGYTFLSSNLFYEIERNTFQFEVSKNISRIILGLGDVHVELRYEPQYHSSQSAGSGATIVSNVRRDKYLSPDLAIEIYKRGSPKYIMIFDAKYRWYKETDGLHYPNDEDIDKMRMYRDRIFHKVHMPTIPLSRLVNIVGSAYILYPGDVVYSEASNAIGALPFVPEMDASLRTDVENLVRKLLMMAHLF